MMRQTFERSKCLLLLGVVLASTLPAAGSHFRYGHYIWTQSDNTTIEVILQNGFRRDGYDCVDLTPPHPVVPCSPGDGFPQVGDVLAERIGNTMFNWGDGSPPIGSDAGPLLYVVTSIDRANNWWFGNALDPESVPEIDTSISHTYPLVGDYTAFTESCCRISSVDEGNEHINNPDGNYRVETIVNVGTENSSPVSVLPPIVLCRVDAVCTFLVPGADPDLDPLSFRLSTSSEAGAPFDQPGPPDAPNAAFIDPETGLYA